MNAVTTIPQSDDRWNTIAEHEQHAWWLSIMLHLLPGVLIAAVYVVVGIPLAARFGYPSLAALLFAVVVALLPVQLGTLLFLGRQRNGRWSLRGVVLYREPLPKHQFAWIVMVLYAWSAAFAVLLAPVDTAVFQALFAWVPPWFLIDVDGTASRGVLIAMQLASIVITGIAAPIVEELYFRGYLLPRIARWGRWAPVINMVLFALYHLWTPWQALSRIVFFLPTVYWTWRKRNVYIAVWVHCLGNTVGGLLMLAAIWAFGSIPSMP